MDTAQILAIIGSIGGWQGVIELLKWWRRRKVQDRQDTAAVVASENDNTRRQVDWLEKRIAERDAKIDSLYQEKNAMAKAYMEEVHRRHEIELQLTEADVKKCLRHGCKDRQPPSDY